MAILTHMACQAHILHLMVTMVKNTIIMAGHALNTLDQVPGCHLQAAWKLREKEERWP